MASYKKNSTGWQVRVSWRDENGELKQKARGGFRLKSEAEAYAASLKKDVSEGLNPLQSSDITFGNYIQQWYETYKQNQSSIATQKRYKNVIKLVKNYFKKAKLSDINRVTYQNFINDFGKSHAKHTVQKANMIIRSCVRNAVYDDVIRKDFTHNVQITYDPKRTRKVEYLSLEDIKKLLQECENGLQPRYTSRYMILTGILTGMRISEVMGLTWDDINYNWQTISINKTWDYQNGGGFKPVKTESSKRIIRVNQALLDILSALKVNDNKMVFANKRGLIPSSNAVNKTLKNIMKDCGLEKQNYHFHSLRHSHVAYLLSQGVDIYAISKRLGHADLSTTTNVYAYLIDEYKEKNDDLIINKLEEIANPGTKHRDKVSK
ncbi:tyrosine-type recombinase/integrase [Ligilactobacillus acidipiscis]|uniref:Integrase family protein n=1 Tax=Ligilactobacillus acidipiscis TaxID=89059 RepID=A0A0R2KFJ6_9LACO|nr:tyrosine-type recombinase/integrase [Ligilactobacillus acidipiscis]KRN88161.1 integrase family protein [Ligilactobacillus acidipiscis]